MSTRHRRTRLTPLAAAAAVVALPVSIAAAAPASADVDRQGSCGTGRYDLDVDREGRGWEVGAGIEGVRPGSTWTVVLRQDGDRFLKVRRTADEEGEVDVDAYRRDSRGADRFTFRASQVGGSTTCGDTITVR